MLFESPADVAFVSAISRLAYCNPFLPERIDCERDALGDQFVKTDSVWNVTTDWDAYRPNIRYIEQRVETLAPALRQRLADGHTSSEKELRLYEDLAAYLLYYRAHKVLQLVTSGELANPKMEIATLYDKFENDAKHFLNVPGVKLPVGYESAHLFAIFFQIRRAFHHIFRTIVGASMPAARLRAAVWQSIFTCDMARYWRVLFDRMNDMTTLITGPSGTGKELVASAIAQSRYIPFDPKSKTFTSDFTELFHPLNLSAMSPTLIESELFGHRRGAFTGALEDRAGWMEVCTATGTVFLDEIGELDPAIQVKLLRVLQTRQFQRLGDVKTRVFRGKIIAATNRDLSREMSDGKFRKDFFYRICSDIIATPALAEQLAETPGDLKGMILFIAKRIAGDEAEALADEVEAWVKKHLGRDYPWPGNFRELEQCVRNVLIRHEYRPQHLGSNSAARDFVDEIHAGELTADELLRRYCTLIYSRTKNLEETARRLKLDRRTVKAKVDPEMLRRRKARNIVRSGADARVWAACGFADQTLSQCRLDSPEQSRASHYGAAMLAPMCLPAKSDIYFINEGKSPEKASENGFDPDRREIVESLTELAAVLESGRSDLKHFKNRTIAGSGKISEQRRRTDYLEEINADYAALNKNRTAMADFKKEMDAWDVTNLDGLARND